MGWVPGLAEVMVGASVVEKVVEMAEVWAGKWAVVLAVLWGWVKAGQALK